MIQCKLDTNANVFEDPTIRIMPLKLNGELTLEEFREVKEVVDPYRFNAGLFGCLISAELTLKRGSLVCNVL